MDVVENLLLLYIGALLINVVLSGLLWLGHRTIQYRSLLLVWASSVVTFVVQGVLSTGDVAIALGFASVFLVTMSMAQLLASVIPVRPPRRVYSVIMGGCTAASALAAALSARFAVVALPLAIGVVVPIIHTSVVVVHRHWAKLSTTGRALVLSCFVYSIHILDFPFLRDRPETAAFGFTVALLIVFALSITASGVVSERIAEERAQIQEIDRVKTQFFANISHELRTPLTVILASLEQLLLSSQFTTEDRRQIEVVRRNAVRLLRLIDEMLDLSKIDAGGLRLNITPFSLRSLASNIAENNQPLAESRKIELVFDRGGTDEIEDLHGDPHRLEIILANLLGNALKYTPKGGRVRVAVVDDPLGAAVQVEDNGPGIPAADLPRVFERFYQVNQKERRQGGVGIGLALAKDLAEMHGGRLTVASDLGRGSTFTLWLPKGKDHFRPEVIERRAAFTPFAENRGNHAEETSAEIRAPVTAVLEDSGTSDLTVGGRRARLLVVEDQDELRAFMVKIFSASFEVLDAADGDEGWEVIQKEKPDLVVSDVMMPHRLGTELCRAIKSDPVLRSTPVILLTARVGSEATLEAYAHGANDFVAKPFHPQVLLARVRAQLQIRSLSFQLASQEKLAAIGTLAAGVAHEVRNPLNFILNATNVLLEDPDPDTARELLEVVADGAKRIDGIVSALNIHARPTDQGMAPAVCDLREGLEATLRLLSHRMKQVELIREYETEQRAWAPPGPINQILMNLLDNAVRSGASKLWLRVIANGDRIRVRIADNGPGVPDDVAERISRSVLHDAPAGRGYGPRALSFPQDGPGLRRVPHPQAPGCRGRRVPARAAPAGRVKIGLKSGADVPKDPDVGGFRLTGGE